MTDGKMTERTECAEHRNFRHSERSEESRVLQRALRSFISRFIEWINSSFLARFHPLICFSREIASAGLSNCSKYKSRRTRYFFVKPGISPRDAPLRAVLNCS